MLPLLSRVTFRLFAATGRMASGGPCYYCLFVLAPPPLAGPPFAEGDNSFHFRVAPDEGVVYDSAEVGLQSCPALFDELWVFVGFGPEMGDREGRQFVLCGNLLTLRAASF